MSGTAAFFEGLGFRPGRFFVVADVFAESPRARFPPAAAAAAIISVMIVAIATVHWSNGPLTNGIDSRFST